MIVRLPLLEPIILSNGVKAFRVMATIENQTKRNLIGARVNVVFGTDKEEVIDILISEKIIYKETSSLNSSHLIRSDVPMNFSLYRSLNKIYKSADVSTIKINLKEIILRTLNKRNLKHHKIEWNLTFLAACLLFQSIFLCQMN